MSPKTIVVHLADPARAGQLLQASLSVSAVCSAYIVGLIVVPPSVTIPAGMPGQPDVIVLDGPRKCALQMVETLGPAFATTLSKSGCRGEIRVVDAEGGSVAQSLIDAARLADLVVVAQARSGWSRIDSLEAPDSVALECGRPVIVVPAAFRSRAIGRRVLIAWNGSREAARATFDALPVLAAADAVKVMWICPEDEPYMAQGMTATQLSAALERHGVRCVTDSLGAPRGAVGQALLAAGEQFGADLMVMGCYGHSRLLEMVLGGATRYVLENMKIPALLSH